MLRYYQPGVGIAELTAWQDHISTAIRTKLPNMKVVLSRLG